MAPTRWVKNTVAYQVVKRNQNPGPTLAATWGGHLGSGKSGLQESTSL